MAVDLSIQVFSFELFNTLFVDHGLVSRGPLPKAIYDTAYCGYKGEIHLNYDIIRAVYCRQSIFHDVYRLQFEYMDASYFDGPSDFIAYMCSTFSSQEFQELKVFEHMLATCAFVVEMGLYCFYKGNSYFIGDAYLFWAMYFDTELKSDFYEQGGWKVLKSVARSYIPPFSVIKNLFDCEKMYLHRSLAHTVPLHKLVAGMENFYNFQTFSDGGENLSRGKTWVDFHLNNKHSQKKSNRVEFDTKTIGGLEHLLRSFKFLCDPLGEVVLEFDASTQNKNTYSTFPVNRDFDKNTMTIFDCNINSFPKLINSFTVVPEPTELRKTIQCFTDAMQALTLEVQSIESKDILNNGTPVGNENQQTSYDDFNTGILSVYDLLKDSLGVDDVQTALSHAPVFMRDKIRNERTIKANVDKISQVTKNPHIIQNEKCQSPLPIISRKIFDGTKCNKENKRTDASHEYVPVVEHSTTSNAGDNNVYPDDTKDILRMVFVLGCQPGYSYVRSTLKNTRK